nr:hypothetical protein [Paraflavitalea speifideiaquila]
MLPTIKPHRTRAWGKLEDHYKKMNRTHLRELFAEDPERFHKFSLQLEDILFDYSKNRITEKTLELLLDLAEECELDKAISAMFSGDPINATEDRAVLHTALRNFSGQPVHAEGRM